MAPNDGPRDIFHTLASYYTVTLIVYSVNSCDKNNYMCMVQV